MSTVLQVLKRADAVPCACGESYNREELWFAQVANVVCQKSCTSQDLSLPGTTIYAKDSHTIYEVDGEENQACLQCVIPDYLC